MSVRKNKKSQLQYIDPASLSKARLLSTLEAMAGQRILVVGDVGVDRYTMGSVERISPEAPVPIVFVQDEQLKLGLAANVADNVCALGGTPLLTGVIGADRAATDFKSLLRRSKISPTHLVTDRKRRTCLKERVISDRQQLLRVDYESVGDISAAVENQILAKAKALLKRADGVILQDYHKGLVSKHLASQLFALAKKSGKGVAVDPNAKTDAQVYRGAWFLTPNAREAEAMSGVAIRDEASLLKAGQSILRTTQAQHVVITRGKDGMAIFTAGESSVHLIPTYAREVYDVSGAGDTVISVLSMALAAGADICEAVVLGNLAAGVEVAKRGTATVSPEEIRIAMDLLLG